MALENRGNLEFEDIGLMIACQSGDVEAARRYIDAGADVNTHKSAPIRSAVVKGNIELIDLLIEHQVDVNVVHQGMRPLTQLTTVATGTRDIVIVRKLIAAGAHVDAQQGESYSPLYCAVTLADLGIRVVETLIAAGANVNAQSKGGKTPLHFAVSKRDQVTIQLLMKHDANVNVADENCSTPLHIAAKHNNLPLVLEMLALHEHKTREQLLHEPFNSVFNFYAHQMIEIANNPGTFNAVAFNQALTDLHGTKYGAVTKPALPRQINIEVAPQEDDDTEEFVSDETTPHTFVLAHNVIDERNVKVHHERYEAAPISATVPLEPGSLASIFDEMLLGDVPNLQE